jgi:cobalt-zinc-cadmium efflux system outer membrane protein
MRPQTTSCTLAIAPLFAALAISSAWAQPAAQPLTLQDLERMALERNPTIGQAKAGVDFAAGRAKQAGLYPNPVLSAVGEEISAGPIIRGGEFGGGIQQRIVTAGKLGLSRKVAQQDQAVAEEASKAQRQRVLNAVRALYYQALADQYRIQVRTNLGKLAAEAVRISHELVNVGQANEPDQLAADVEAQRIQLELADAMDRQERTWRQLAAVVNDASLKPVPLTGELENVPRLELEQALATIYSDSPEIRAANIGVTQSDLALRRAKVEKIPDVIVAGGVRDNRELLEQGTAGILRPVGREGFFDISVEIPIFNRNQGNVAAARAELERAKLEVDRTKLALRSRLAEVYRDYRTALTRADRYKQEVLPKAQRAYELYLNSFRQMAAAYPQALIAQRNLFQLQDDFVNALVTVWQRSVEIQGLLLTGGVEVSGVGLTTENPLPGSMMRSGAAGGASGQN